MRTILIFIILTMIAYKPSISANSQDQLLDTIPQQGDSIRRAEEDRKREEEYRKRDELALSSEFIPSEFTKDRELQEELSKFLFKKEWISDYRELIYQGNEDYTDYINLYDSDIKTAPFKFDCNTVVLKSKSAFRNEDAQVCQILDSSFLESLNAISSKSSNRSLELYIPVNYYSEISLKVYVYGRVVLDTKKGIESYIVVYEYRIAGTKYIDESYTLKSFLITQNKDRVLSVLQLNYDSVLMGHSTRSRTIRLEDNRFACQSEYMGDLITRYESLEQADEAGKKNWTTFRVYEITRDGFVRGVRPR